MQKFLFFIALLVAFTSCNDEEVITPIKTKTRTELLLHGGSAWKVTAAIVDPPLPVKGTLITDFFAQLQDCDKDDTYLYSANPITATSGSYILSNPVKCKPTEQSTSTGTWSFNGDDLVTDGGKETILSLDETALKTKQVIPLNGVNYSVTVTYK